MTRRHLELIHALPPAELPEVLLVRRLDEVRTLCLGMPFTWLLPQAWFALYAALDRLEAQRIRTLKGW